MSQTVDRPKGSIRTADGVMAAIRDAAEMEVTLYYVYGLGKASSISPIMITPQHRLEGRMLMGGSGSAALSLLDCNVDRLNCYNDHYLFDHKLHAENYLKVCLASAKQEAATQAHWRRCSRWLF